MKNIVAGARQPRGLIAYRLMGGRGRIALSTTAILLALFAFGSRSDAQSESVIALFGYPTAAIPDGVIANDGILFGNSQDGGPQSNGSVFALRPPAVPGGPWSKAVPYDFNYSLGGIEPHGLLLAGANHVLYGVTGDGVFALQPPAGGGTPWIETTLYIFDSYPSDASGPFGGLIADANGTLYGTSVYGGFATICGPGGGLGCGTVFSLTPPSTPGGAWTENVLYSFSGGSDGSGPTSGLLLGQNGVLYGTTWSGGAAGQGVVYALTPPSSPGGAWVESTVYSFQGLLDGAVPDGTLVAYKNGDLVGTCQYGGHYSSHGLKGSGTVFELTPPSTPGSPWTEHTLWTFGVVPGDGTNPQNGVTLVDGQFYGSTVSGGAYQVGLYQAGTVFQLTPPAALGGPWTETILHSFNPNPGTIDGSEPFSPLSLGPGGALYGSTLYGPPGAGTVYEVTLP